MMRWLAWTVVLFLLLPLAGCNAAVPVDADASGASESSGSDQFVVMSFNIRNGRANDGKNSWPNRRDLVSGVIRQNDADIVGLQEAFRFQMDQLAEDLPQYTEVGEGRAGGTKDEYSAILYRTARYTLLDSGTFWLSDTPDRVSKSWGNALLRICTWARLRDRNTGESFYLYNTHFDHRSQLARVNSAKLIRQRIADRATDDPIIITGDMNAGEDNPAITTLKAKDTEYPLRDTFRVLYPDATNVGTGNGGYTGRTNGAKIDYVFISPGFETLSASIDQESRDGRYPSDHYPVTATLRIGKPGE